MDDKINELISRGVETIYPSTQAFETVLRSGKKLTVYQGFDPTGIQMHIGHMVGLRKLAQFQKLGHHVIFLIGDGTGLAGDPSGKTRMREKFLSREELRKNATDYVKQAGKIVDFTGDNPAEIRFNGDWLTELKLEDILKIADSFTLQQLFERDLFQDRIKRGEPINMREFLYPLLQGYDSVAMDVDVEIGGSDQMFNMLCGRTLLHTMLHKEKFVLTTPLLVDASGRKIGKTEGNVIALTDKSEELFAKIMALPDEVIVKTFEYLTDLENSSIKDVEQALMNGVNPINYKKDLARAIVSILNNDLAAEQAQNEFEKRVQHKEMPETVKEVKIGKDELASLSFTELLGRLDLVQSNSEAKRLIQQGGVKVNNKTITNVHDTLASSIDGSEIFIQVGKFKFRKLLIVEE